MAGVVLCDVEGGNGWMEADGVLRGIEIPPRKNSMASTQSRFYSIIYTRIESNLGITSVPIRQIFF